MTDMTPPAAREAYEAWMRSVGRVPDRFDHMSAHFKAAWTAAAEAAVKAERNACADIADQHASTEGIAQKIAAQIRARGERHG